MPDAKRNILEKIHRALQMQPGQPDEPGQPAQSPLPDGEITEVFKGGNDALIDRFRREFEAIQGCFVHCFNKQELLQQLTALVHRKKAEGKIVCYSRIAREYSEGPEWDTITQAAPNNNLDAHIGITDCEYLLASTGTIVMSSSQPAGRVFPVYVPVHVVIATERQLVYDIGELFNVREELTAEAAPSALYLISGPSRTGDIEKTLVLGVHGPLELFVFLINDNLE